MGVWGMDIPHQEGGVLLSKEGVGVQQLQSQSSPEGHQ